MLTDDGIKLIQRTAIDAEHARLPPEIEAAGAVALPTDYSLHDLEQFRTGRRRYRGILKTDSLDDFVAYVNRQGDGDGFVDAAQLSATVYFNLGDTHDPGHGDYRACLTLTSTAAFSALCKRNGEPAEQRALVDWLEDWAPNLQALEQIQEPKGMTLASAISAVRQVTISTKSDVETTEGDFRAARSAMEEVEAKSRSGLPAGFIFKCVPYLGLRERSFLLRLSVRTSGPKPLLVLRLAQLEAEQEDMAREFKEKLKDEIDEGIPLTIGRFAV